jgi:hypothetical protein
LSTGLADLVGEWSGTYGLWLKPDDPGIETTTNATVALAARGRFATIDYTWTVNDQLEEGLIVIQAAAKPGAVGVVWVDSWHMGDTLLLCENEREGDAIVSAKGFYAASPDPDWGWRIAVVAAAPDTFRVVMHNITPAGDEALAVEAKYRRA